MSQHDSFAEAPFARAEPHPSAPPSRRTHPRFAIELDVSLGKNHDSYAGFVENLSLDGAFIATHVSAPVGARLELVIHLPDAAPPIPATVQVRWRRAFSEHGDVPPGMGVQFLDMEPRARAALEQLIRANRPSLW